MDTLVARSNDLMRAGQVLADWPKTSSRMLPKIMRAKVPSNYRPIATIRWFYIQIFCLHGLGTGGNPTGNPSARRTPWFLGRQTC